MRRVGLADMTRGRWSSKTLHQSRRHIGSGAAGGTAALHRAVKQEVGDTGEGLLEREEEFPEQDPLPSAFYKTSYARKYSRRDLEGEGNQGGAPSTQTRDRQQIKRQSLQDLVTQQPRAKKDVAFQRLPRSGKAEPEQKREELPPSRSLTHSEEASIERVSNLVHKVASRTTPKVERWLYLWASSTNRRAIDHTMDIEEGGSGGGGGGLALDQSASSLALPDGRETPLSSVAAVVGEDEGVLVEEEVDPSGSFSWGPLLSSKGKEKVPTAMPERSTDATKNSRTSSVKVRDQDLEAHSQRLRHTIRLGGEALTLLATDRSLRRPKLFPPERCVDLWRLYSLRVTIRRLQKRSERQEKLRKILNRYPSSATLPTGTTAVEAALAPSQVPVPQIFGAALERKQRAIARHRKLDLLRSQLKRDRRVSRVKEQRPGSYNRTTAATNATTAESPARRKFPLQKSLTQRTIDLVDLFNMDQIVAVLSSLQRLEIKDERLVGKLVRQMATFPLSAVNPSQAFAVVSFLGQQDVAGNHKIDEVVRRWEPLLLKAVTALGDNLQEERIEKEQLLEAGLTNSSHRAGLQGPTSTTATTTRLRSLLFPFLQSVVKYDFPPSPFTARCLDLANEFILPDLTSVHQCEQFLRAVVGGEKVRQQQLEERQRLRKAKELRTGLEFLALRTAKGLSVHTERNHFTKALLPRIVERVFSIEGLLQFDAPTTLPAAASAQGIHLTAPTMSGGALPVQVAALAGAEESYLTKKDVGEKVLPLLSFAPVLLRTLLWTEPDSSNRRAVQLSLAKGLERVLTKQVQDTSPTHHHSSGTVASRLEPERLIKLVNGVFNFAALPDNCQLIHLLLKESLNKWIPSLQQDAHRPSGKKEQEEGAAATTTTTTSGGTHRLLNPTALTRMTNFGDLFSDWLRAAHHTHYDVTYFSAAAGGDGQKKLIRELNLLLLENLDRLSDVGFVCGVSWLQVKEHCTKEELAVVHQHLQNIMGRLSPAQYIQAASHYHQFSAVADKVSVRRTFDRLEELPVAAMLKPTDIAGILSALQDTETFLVAGLIGERLRGQALHLVDVGRVQVRNPFALNRSAGLAGTTASPVSNAVGFAAPSGIAQTPSETASTETGELVVFMKALVRCGLIDSSMYVKLMNHWGRITGLFDTTKSAAAAAAGGGEGGVTRGCSVGSTLSIGELLPPLEILTELFIEHGSEWKEDNFRQSWSVFRRRIIDEAHQLSFAVAVRALNLTSFFDPTDDAVSVSLTQRLLQLLGDSTVAFNLSAEFASGGSAESSQASSAAVMDYLRPIGNYLRKTLSVRASVAVLRVFRRLHDDWMISDWKQNQTKEISTTTSTPQRQPHFLERPERQIVAALIPSLIFSWPEKRVALSLSDCYLALPTILPWMTLTSRQTQQTSTTGAGAPVDAMALVDQLEHELITASSVVFGFLRHRILMEYVEYVAAPSSLSMNELKAEGTEQEEKEKSAAEVAMGTKPVPQSTELNTDLSVQTSSASSPPPALREPELLHPDYYVNSLTAFAAYSFIDGPLIEEGLLYPLQEKRVLQSMEPDAVVRVVLSLCGGLLRLPDALRARTVNFITRRESLGSSKGKLGEGIPSIPPHFNGTGIEEKVIQRASTFLWPFIRQLCLVEKRLSPEDMSAVARVLVQWAVTKDDLAAPPNFVDAEVAAPSLDIVCSRIASVVPCWRLLQEERMSRRKKSAQAVQQRRTSSGNGLETKGQNPTAAFGIAFCAKLEHELLSLAKLAQPREKRTQASPLQAAQQLPKPPPPPPLVSDVAPSAEDLFLGLE